MKINFIKSIAVAAIVASCAFITTLATAQDKDVPTYLLANLLVENMDAYLSDYASPLGPVLQKAGGEILVVAPDVNRLEGDYGSNLTVVIRFPSAELANAFYASEAYAVLRPARQANTDMTKSTLVLAPEFSMPSSE